MSRWKIERFGLLNFWYYDEEVFNLEDGKLLLRGANGSGKSVTMQSFIPLLLDGNTRPERLDPFGSRARKIDTYILPEESSEDESTGYLYMEFYKKDEKKYNTLGMGIRVKKGSGNKIWYFSITDGRRIGYDFKLYKDSLNKIPLSKMELKNAIGLGGEVKETQKEYAEMINRILFGFENTPEYEELVSLLINLRSPKLSKDFRPRDTYEILESSLQPLSDDDLRPMTEAIENMDEMAENLSALKQAKKNTENIKKYYDRYNQYILLEKSKWYIKAKEDIDNINKKLSNTDNEINEMKLLKDNKANKKIELEYEKNELEDNIAILEKSEIFQIKSEMLRINREIEEKTKEISKKETIFEEKDNILKKEYASLKKNNNDIENIKYEIEEILQENADIIEEYDFYEDEAFRNEFEKNIEAEYNFAYIIKEVEKMIENFRKGKEFIQKYEDKIKEYDKILYEYDILEKDIESLLKKLENEEEKLSEEKAVYDEEFNNWGNNCKELNLKKDSYEEVVKIISAYEERESYHNIKNIVQIDYNTAVDKINEDIFNEMLEKQEKESEINICNEELKKWLENKEIIYEEDEKFTKYYDRLKNEKKKFLRLWEALEFREETDENTRAVIEEILNDTGILGAVIPIDILPETMEDEGRKLINFDNTDIYNENNLFKYLNYDDKLDENIKMKLKKILESISVNQDKNEFSIFLDGKYKTKYINGITNRQSKTKFIGNSSRERYRLSKIEEIREKINNLEDEKNIIKERLNKLNDRKNLLKTEYESIPKCDNLDKCMKNIYETEKNIELKNKELSKLKENKDKIYNEKEELKKLVDEYTEKTKIQASSSKYEKAIEELDWYRKNIYEIEKKHRDFINKKVINDSLKYSIERIEYDIDNIKIELNELKSIVISKQKIHEELIERAKIEGTEEILKRFNEIKKKIKDIEIESDKISKELGSLEAKIENAVKELSLLNEEKIKKNIIENYYETGLLNEINLGYVINNLEFNIKNIKKMEEELENQIDYKKGRDQFSGDLNEKFNSNKNYISEYNTVLEYIFDEEKENEILANEFKMQRADIKGKDKDKIISFNQILEDITSRIEHDESLLQNKEKELFEEILIKTISRKITEKIEQSEKWVKKMNERMESMDTDTIRLGLNWEGKKTDEEEELNSEELVKLLRLNDFVRKESDVEKIVQHFKSKILYARKEMEKDENTNSFHKIMTELLDYRKWYEFKLSYKRVGGNKKELTQNEFYKFSGGEKAMTMYVPLFAAVSARYENAKKDCPKIISLDEAFAGVDEKNIRNMFKLMVELGFDFVINSQILWGDYDTVPLLAIAELYRPNNSNVVTVFRYRWNGNKRESIMHEGLVNKDTGMIKMF